MSGFSESVGAKWQRAVEARADGWRKKHEERKRKLADYDRLRSLLVEARDAAKRIESVVGQGRALVKSEADDRYLAVVQSVVVALLARLDEEVGGKCGTCDGDGLLPKKDPAKVLQGDRCEECPECNGGRGRK